ncbi:isorenieratene synthase [Microlunatus endophyticus]|uniref:Isorenieratene synthase n=1 Tax=Microlunatus endophyticus TaxID=1716077 RepID=A0A917S759_9ACTN|nr:FAD-dependent oxidoreductase [Microlunatus endophyticus]GGL61769.1 isorenieratene synthase [Microlunatus endophyticus]
MSRPTSRGTDRAWRPGRDRRAELLPAIAGRPVADHGRSVAVIGGGIAGLAAATALLERGVAVTVLERQPYFGGRAGAWPVRHAADSVTMSRGFHAFFRQYYNLRGLLRRADPGLDRLRPVGDYPIRLAGGPTDSFARIPRTPPLSIAGFVLTSSSIRARDLARVDVGHALGLLDVDFPDTFSAWDRVSAAEFLDRLRFPAQARHLALEVFARSFFADPADFAAGELLAMFHSYFVGSSEGLLFDVPDDDYDSALWGPLSRRLADQGADLLLETDVHSIDLAEQTVRVRHRPAGSTVGDGAELTCDAVVIAVDPGGLAGLARGVTAGVTGGITGGITGADPDWLRQLGAVRTAPPFAVWRLWLDRPVAPGRPAFLATSGYGPLDNISVLDRYEAGSARWAAERGGSVVELHAYALGGSGWSGSDPGHRAAAGQLKSRLRTELAAVYPETAEARVLAEEWRTDQDCVLVGPGPWADRPTVGTPDPRVVLAGDAIRCELPVALMERAATTGFQAANQLLAGWGVRGHDLWTVPRQSRQRWPGALRHLLVRRLLGRQPLQPGNSPRHRNA